jgi:hypothetical protein
MQTSGRRSGYGSGAGRGCPSTRPRRTRIYVASRSQSPYDTRRGQSCRMTYCGPGPGESGPGGPVRAGRARPTEPTRGVQAQPCGCPRTELQNELPCCEFGQADRELRPGIQVVSAGRNPERGESREPGAQQSAAIAGIIGGGGKTASRAANEARAVIRSAASAWPGRAEPARTAITTRKGNLGCGTASLAAGVPGQDTLPRMAPSQPGPRGEKHRPAGTQSD